MKSWLLLLAFLPGFAFAQTHVKQPFTYSWDYATTVDRFELKLDVGAYVSVGLPPVTAGTYTLKGDAALTGSHSAVVRACIAAAVPPCSPDSNTVAFIVDVPAPAPVPGTPTNLRIVASVAPSTVKLAPTGDTFLNLNAVNSSAGAVLALYTWPTNQVANAIVMTFDLASIPAGSTIVSATLSLNLTEAGADGGVEAPTYTVTAHRIVNKKPVVTLATGFTYDGVNAWTANACCQGGVPLAQADISAPVDTKGVDKVLGFKTWDVTAIVQSWWANPTTNFGLLVNSDPTKAGGNHRYFSSSEDPIVGNRPSMTVVYR